MKATNHTRAPERITARTVRRYGITRKWLKARCTEERGCWIWRGKNAGGYPNAHVVGKDAAINVRRAAAALEYKEVADGVPVGLICGNRRCVNPAHTRVSTRSAIGKAAAKAGAWDNARRGASISYARISRSLITLEARREILTAERGTLRDVCARHGVDYGTGKAIRYRQIGAREAFGVWAGLI
jgi:hypothetical protein